MTLTNKEIFNILNKYVFDMLKEQADVKLLGFFDEGDPDKNLIWCLRAFGGTSVDSGEMGEYGSSVRTSTFIVSYSIENSSDIQRLLELCDMTINNFRRTEIEGIWCTEPYATYLGVIEGDRLSYSITIPFYTWTAKQ